MSDQSINDQVSFDSDSWPEAQTLERIQTENYELFSYSSASSADFGHFHFSAEVKLHLHFLYYSF